MTATRTTIAMMAFLLVFGFAVSRAAEDKTNTICQLCGMDAAKSETEFILRRKSEPAMHACCINCARRLLKKVGDEVTEITVLDYGTRKHVAASEAFYVQGSERVPKGSMAPFVFAFGARKDAEHFKSRYGGVVRTFSRIVEDLDSDSKKQ